MGNATILAHRLARLGEKKGSDPYFLVELGGGDGTLLLDVARRTAGRIKNVRCLLVDQQYLLTRETRDRFAGLSWDVDAAQADVFDWLRRPASPSSDTMLANLFLHHFPDDRLRALLRAVSQHTSAFIACEPLRSRMAFAAASMMRLIGCNDVSIHDARQSVRAGFSDRDLSALWPGDAQWTLVERRAGLFTHAFEACRSSPDGAP
jgi:Methyltransferase domain